MLKSRHDFHTENSNEYKTVKEVGGVLDLNLCPLSDHALYSYQVWQKYLKGSQTIQLT